MQKGKTQGLHKDSPVVAFEERIEKVRRIESASNAKYKHIKSLYQKKNRIKYGEYVTEGIKSVEAAINANKEIVMIAVSETFLRESNFEYPVGAEVVVLEDSLFERMCDTKNPQGIAAVVQIRGASEFLPSMEKAYVFCDNVTDPGNLGTIIRTADAAGMGAVLLSKGCVDPYNPKTVRAAMGSLFNIEVTENADTDTLAAMKESGFSLYGGALGDDSRDYREPDYTKPSVIIVGNEANGIRNEVLEMCQKVKIPILGDAESLNAAVAASILMYEIVRNRT